MNVTQAHTYCASLAGATLDHKWAFEDSVHPVYSVGGRMFAMFSMKAGKLVDTLMFKADDARFLELTDRPGIVPAPYLARAKWVKIDGVRRLADVELKQLLDEAHVVILGKSSKKAQAAILAASGVVPAAAARPHRATRSSSAPTSGKAKDATSAFDRSTTRPSNERPSATNSSTTDPSTTNPSTTRPSAKRPSTTRVPTNAAATAGAPVVRAPKR